MSCCVSNRFMMTTPLFVSGGCCNPFMSNMAFSGPSCFGWGFGGCCGDSFNSKSMMFGMGMGIGCGLGALLVNNLPAICKGVGRAASWVWNTAFPAIGKGIGQAASWLWNKAFPAIGKGIASAAKWVWGGITSAGKAIAGIFKKKSSANASSSA